MPNILGFTPLQLSAVLMGVLILQLLTYLLWGVACVAHPIYQFYLNSAWVWPMMAVYAIAAVLAATIMVVSLSNQVHPAWQRRWLVAVLMFYVAVMLLAGFVSGLLNISLGVVFAGAPMVVMAVLPSVRTLMVLWGLGIMVGGIVYLSASGMIPYAPLFQEQLISQSSDYGIFFFWSQMYFVWPFVGVLLIMAQQIWNLGQKKQQELRKLHQTDALTGLADRRVAYRRLQARLHDQRPCAVMLFQLDEFHQIYRQHGMLNADQMLSRVAKELTDSLRSSDLITRFDNTQFLVVLDGIDCQTAISIANRCQERLGSLECLAERQFIPVHLSVGVMCTSPQHTTLDQVLTEVERALNDAMHLGGQQVAGHACPITQHAWQQPNHRLHLRYHA